MKIKSDKGFVGIDISIAVLVIIILIPTIMSIVFNSNSSSLENSIKVEALNIAVNTIEISKGIELSELTPSKIIQKLGENYAEYNIAQSSGNQSIATAQTQTASYRINIEVTDYNNDNIVKTVKVTVTYKIDNVEKSIDLSIVL